MSTKEPASDGNAVGGNANDGSDSDARKAAAESLRRQIQKLKEGRPPRTLHEFVEEKMSEDADATEHSDN
jgi:hypothetical protein